MTKNNLAKTTISIKKVIPMALVSAAIVGLSGCAAMNTAITHRNLETQTKMSQSVFLQPVPKSQKTVFVDIHNASNQRLNLTPKIKLALQDNGYKVVNSINSAHYMLQANVMKVAKLSKTAADEALTGGYGGAVSGAAIGAATAAATSGSNESIIGGGLIGGIVGSVTNDLVTDTTYSMITDVQISERLAKGVKAQSSTLSHMQQGLSTQTVTRLSAKSNWMKYRTRIVSTADKVNLKFAYAKPVLERQLAHAIASIF